MFLTFFFAASTQIPGTKPVAIVTNVHGGGGSVGDLTIIWDVSCILYCSSCLGNDIVYTSYFYGACIRILNTMHDTWKL